jgi:hypothetical protein
LETAICVPAGVMAQPAGVDAGSTGGAGSAAIAGAVPHNTAIPSASAADMPRHPLTRIANPPAACRLLD